MAGAVKDVSFDLKKMMGAKEKAVRGLTGGIEFLLKKYGVDYVKGFGKLTGANEVTADLTEGGSKVMKTKRVLIATGSEVGAQLRALLLRAATRTLHVSTRASTSPALVLTSRPTPCARLRWYPHRSPRCPRAPSTTRSAASWTPRARCR